ncbi:MAG: methionine--tRNA ligase [Candidatus Nealsonbacteria bacterium CG10_big_fil_rev_8_21_14_0_10_36_228]|uniref:methionine--tRNA ligase n=2 Tax=Candidatus Nealsoniibacteriota TaxID=1817911 RepID=A0A2H0TKQ0_9BACT|nr:MAG: methionine--tRNA ligase [Candidatus Nealsonbacteria bacterium CG10_big_fil_rev_8_21_14_0_10_36_228]
MTKNKKFYITTSIAYTNTPPHIGYALELIQADVLARYHRILGKKVFFLTGTDEHGQKVVKAAEEAEKEPKEFTDKITARFKLLTKVLNLSNTDFIRTTDEKRHWPVAREVWLKLKENGDIYKKNYKGLYCVGCEAFITKKDLINGKCKIHQKEPEVVEEENYFFRLSKYSKQIKEIIKKDNVKIIPEERKNEMLNFVSQGLEDVSFSRPRKDLKWGIPVPDDNSQTIYVWADALINYISALDYPNGENFKKYWPADVHCLGKDILRFHSTIWLGMLLSLGLELPKNIFVHGFITSNGQKMSKSLGNVIDPFELVKKYGTDAVRYFLLREITPTEDGDFTYEKFEARYNSDLASGLGNLVARVLTLATKLKIKNEKFKITNQNLKSIIDETWKNYKKALDEFKFNEVLISIWELISVCDRYIEKERPWEKSEKQQLTINNLLFTIDNIAQLLKPFLPETSEKVLEQFKTKKIKILFPRLK